MTRKKVLNDTQRCLSRNPLSFKGVNIKAILELDPRKMPWSKAQAIFIDAMKKHANVSREFFDIRWVDTGLRVSVTNPLQRAAITIALVYHKCKMDTEF